MSKTTTMFILESTVYINALKIDDPEIAEFLSYIPQGDQVPTLVNAIRLGVFCLEQAQTNRVHRSHGDSACN
jgi:hypothetical protein